MVRVSIMLCALFCGIASVFGAELTVVCTGNTYAALYPCKTCSSTAQGGIPRRAAALTALREEHANVLVVDAGNFTAGTAADINSINYSFDMKRTEYAYHAFEAMKYDAVCVGEAEFNFGTQFLRDRKMRTVPLVSCNITLEGVVPYVIKSYPEFTVGITGLTSQEIAERNGIESVPYRDAFRKVVDKIKTKVDVIILLSNAPSAVNEKLSREFAGIPLIISSGARRRAGTYEKYGETTVVYPPYGGRNLQVVTLPLGGPGASSLRVASNALGPEVASDSSLNEYLPVCFSDSDCVYREGLASKCKNAGRQDSYCMYVEAEAIPALMITDKRCPFCVTGRTERLIERLFLGVTITSLDYRDDDARALIKKYGIKTLPAFILPSRVHTLGGFEHFAGNLITRKDAYLLDERFSGIFLFLERKEASRRIDVFFSLHDKNLHESLLGLKHFCEKSNVVLRAHVLPELARGQENPYEREERKRMLAVQRLYPRKFWEYCLRRVGDISSAWWPDIMKEAGIAASDIKRLAASSGMDDILDKEESLARQLHVQSGIAILVNNVRLFRVTSISEEDLRKILDL